MGGKFFVFKPHRKFNCSSNKHSISATLHNCRGKTHTETVSEKSFESKTQTYFHNLQPQFYLGFQQWCRSSYHCMQRMFTWKWHSQVDRLWLSLPLPQRQSYWLSFLHGRAAWCPQAPWRCSCHPRMGKWQGRWLRRVAPGSIPPILARWKGRDGEPSLSALIEGQPSISHRQSQRSAKACGWVLHVQPIEQLVLTSDEQVLATLVCAVAAWGWPLLSE